MNLWAEHGWCMHPGLAVELIAHTGREGGSIPLLLRLPSEASSPATQPLVRDCGVRR